MKKDQLLKQLENMELPELVVESHKARLKAVLLEGIPVSKHAEKIYGSRSSIFTEFWSWLTGTTWRTAMASALSLVIIGTILGAVFYFAAPSPAVMAADIVKRDPGIQQKLSGTGEIIIIKVEVRDRLATVVCGRSMGDFIQADVDIDGHSVVNTKHYEGLFMPEVPLEEQDNAVKIARQETAIKALVDKGATFGKVFPVFSSISKITVINGNIMMVTPTTTQAIVPVDLNGKIWLVQVNLESKTVEHVIEPQSGSSSDLNLYYIFQQS